MVAHQSTQDPRAASIDSPPKDLENSSVQDASFSTRPRVAVFALTSETARAGSIVEKLDGNGVEVVITERHTADDWFGGRSGTIHAAVVVIPSRTFSDWAASDLNPFVEACRSRGVAILMVFPDVSAWSHGERRRYPHSELAAAIDDLVRRANQRFAEQLASPGPAAIEGS